MNTSIYLTGLSTSEALAAQKKFGPNSVETNTTTAWNIFLRQVKSPFIYLLLTAAILSFGLKEPVDALMIILFISINISLGFYQEYRSEQTARLLIHFIKREVVVLRDTVFKSLPSEELVPGDTIRLKPGDIVPADGTLTECENNEIEIDESILTGESRSVIKKVGDMLLAGTTILSGSGLGKITKTGDTSELGTIAKIAAETTKVSGFEKNITQLSTFTLKLISIILLVTYITNLILKGPSSFLETTLFSIALAVSVIPEALPVVTTFSLSRGALHLAKHKVIVKRLSAIEDLGGIEILAIDKTGTITENKLAIAEIFTADKTALLEYASHAATSGDTIDTALNIPGTDVTPVAEIPFDPIRKHSSILIKEETSLRLILKGVPEIIEKVTNNKLSSEQKNWLTAQELLGRRVIAVATRVVKTRPSSLNTIEIGSRIIGLIALSDHLKTSSFAALALAKKLNVQIKMISGDSQNVCTTIAKEVGLITEDAQVISGDALALLSNEELHQVVQKIIVFARTSPIQKRQIIQILEENHNVGFVGDGINDAPTLKIANVAIAVDGASDVAREAADIILTNPSLHTIMTGIAEGRTVFANTSKYIKITLAANVGNFFSVAIASLLIPYLPMLPVQILLVNLLTDFPMITVATDSVDLGELSKPQIYNMHEIASTAVVFGIVSSTFDLIFFASFVHFAGAVLQTNWFLESVLTELLFFFSMRTKLPFWKAIRPPRSILLLTTIVIAITLALPYTTFGKVNLQFIAPTETHLLMLASIVVAYLITTEAVKLFYYKSQKNLALPMLA